LLIPLPSRFIAASIAGAGEACPGKGDWKIGRKSNILLNTTLMVAIHAKF
jgi:hypothetical protein